MTKVDLNIALKPPFAKRYENYIGGEWRALEEDIAQPASAA